MLLSYVVYAQLVIVVCLLTYYISKKHGIKSSVLVIPVTYYALIIGMRYEIGTDWGAYKDFFLEVASGYYWGMEIGYTSLNRLVALFFSDYQFLFIAIAIMQISLLYKFFDEYRFLAVWGVFLFFVAGPFFSSLNIIRQSLSFFVFLCSIKYIKEKKWKAYLVSIMIACCFHSSSIILLPLYFINKMSDKLINNKLLLFLIYCIAFFYGTVVMERLGEVFFQLINAPQYARYATDFTTNTFEYGIGFWGIKLIDLTLLLYAGKLSKYYQDQSFSIIWYIYFVGLIIFNMGMANQLTIRLSYNMLSLRFVVLAFLFHYTFNVVRSNQKLITVVSFSILFFYIVTFFTSIAQGQNGCSPFRFAFFNE